MTTETLHSPITAAVRATATYTAANANQTLLQTMYSIPADATSARTVIEATAFGDIAPVNIGTVWTLAFQIRLNGAGGTLVLPFGAFSMLISSAVVGGWMMRWLGVIEGGNLIRSGGSFSIDPAIVTSVASNVIHTAVATGIAITQANANTLDLTLADSRGATVADVVHLYGAAVEMRHTPT